MEETLDEIIDVYFKFLEEQEPLGEDFELVWDENIEDLLQE